MNSRLTTTLAIFRIEQDNVAQSTGTLIPGINGENPADKAVDGTVSKGVEFELNGAITDNWQRHLAQRAILQRITGYAVNPNLPCTTVKMFTSYRLLVMPTQSAVVLTGKIA